MQGVFDIGGTGYRTATIDDRWQIADVRCGETKQEYRQGILKLVESLESSGAKGRLEKVVGCVAGKFDEERSKLVFSPNLLDWVDKPIRKDLEERLGCEVILENDAVAEGLGEAVAGAGRGFSKLMYFTAGTGIGGSLIQMTDDNLPAGRQGWQMTDIEPGWTIKIGDKFLEEVAGGKAIGDIKLVDWSREADLLADGINQLVEKYQPEIVVVGGSLFKSIDWEYFRKKITIQVVKSVLGQEAGLWGCAELLKH